jgi:tryptophanase
MDANQIVDMSDDSRQVPKDQRVLHQQRAVLMNSDECISQYKAYHERLAARKAASGTSRTVGGEKGPSAAQLYQSWVKTLTAEQVRAEDAVCVAAGGKVKRRKEKADELRAAGWTPPAQIEEN